MRGIVSFLVALALLAPVPAAASSERDEQGAARKEMRAGNIRKSSEIENAIIPRMQGWQYLGFDYDSTAMAYRLKFIRDGRVSYVDVDARSGEVLHQSR